MFPCHIATSYPTTIDETFAYYSNIEGYQNIYPKYFATVDIVYREIEDSIETLVAKMFLNYPLTDKDHVLIEVKYRFFPPTEIQYEIVSGEKEGLKNSLKLIDRSSEGDPSRKCGVRYNNVVLDLISLPPVYPPFKYFDIYQKTIDYFMFMDVEHLKKIKTGFKIGDLCNKCKKGHLRYSPKRVITDTVSTKYFNCDYCGWEFKNYDTTFRDGVSLSDSTENKTSNGSDEDPLE